MRCDDRHLLPSGAGTRRWKRFAPLISLVLIQWVLGGYAIATDPMIGDDACFYVTLATYTREFPAEVFRVRAYNSGFSFMVSGLRFLLPSADSPAQDRLLWETAARLVSLLGGTLGLICLWHIARRIIDDTNICWWGILLLILGRKFATSFGLPLTDMPAWGVCQLGLLLGVLTYEKIQAGKLHSAGWAALTALVAAIGFYIRHEAAGVGIVSGLLWLSLLLGHSSKWKLIALSLTVATAVSAAAASPHLLYREAGGARHVPEEFGFTSPGANNASTNTPPEKIGKPPSPANRITTTPANRITTTVGLTVAMTSALHPVTALFIILWLILFTASHLFHWRIGDSIGKLRRPGCVIVICTTLIFLPPVILRCFALGVISWRYVMLLASLYCIFGGAGLVGLWRLLQKTRWRLPRVAYSSIISFLLLATLLHTLRPTRNHLLVLKEAGLYLQTKLGPDDILVYEKYKHIIPYYAAIYDPCHIANLFPSLPNLPKCKEQLMSFFKAPQRRNSRLQGKWVEEYFNTVSPGSIWIALRTEEGSPFIKRAQEELGSWGFVEHRIFYTRPPDSPWARWYYDHITPIFERTYSKPLSVYVFRGPKLHPGDRASQPALPNDPTPSTRPD
jgi:hypothetical protein